MTMKMSSGYSPSYDKRRYERRAAKGMCVNCGNQAARAGLKQCAVCAGKQRHRHERLKAKRLCIVCGKVKAKRGQQRCHDCWDHRKRLINMRRRDKMAQGFCACCLKRQAVAGKTRCQPCADRLNEYQRSYVAKRRANG